MLALHAARHSRVCLAQGPQALVGKGVARWASSPRFKERLLQTPKNYYGPRIAVFSACAVGSVALYELVTEALRRFSTPSAPDYRVWDAEWDSGPLEAESPSGSQESSPTVAAGLIARRIREAADDQVQRRHVVFVRHAQPGESEANGKTPPPLSQAGCKQAELTGRRLQEMFGEEIVAVYHAGSEEARATAEVIHRKLAGGRSKGAEPRLVESVLLAESIPSMPSPTPPGLDTLEEAVLAQDRARAEGAFKAYIWRPQGGCGGEGRSSVEVLVAPGNVIRFLVCRALQLPETAWSRLAANHCTITWLELDWDGAVALREFGGVGHLPPDTITYH